MNETSAFAELLERLAIADLVQFERMYRDQQQWEKLSTCYHPDSFIRLGWFEGTGDEYVTASRKLESRKASWHLTHLTGPTQVQVYKDRALAETNTLIIRRSVMEGVLADATIYCRLCSRVEKRAGAWKLLTLDAVYEKDTLVPVYPSDRLELRQEELAQYPPAYRFTAYNLQRLGYSVKPEQLYSTENPERVAQFYGEATNWLYQASNADNS